MFHRLFASAPRVYVEHSAGNKKDAQVNEGSRLSSQYYNTDLLNESGAWIWVDHWSSFTHKRARFYDVLDDMGSPFNATVAEAFGIRKGFVRSGRAREATGDGFLDCYSQQNTQDLARRCGLALVYTHLDSGWLDPQTKQLRASIRQRLEFIASLNPWRMPAGRILDRFQLIATLSLHESDDVLVVSNAGGEPVCGVTLIAPAEDVALRHGTQVLVPAADGRLVIGDLAAHSEMRFDKQRA